MSANNSLIIMNRKKKFYAFEISAEDTREPDEIFKDDKPEFTAETIEGALALANKFCRENIVEYGYTFIGY